MSLALIIGSGGREHALGWKLSRSQEISQVWYLPGNGGTWGCNIAVDPDAPLVDQIMKLVSSVEKSMVIIGSEEFLAQGLVDELLARGYSNVFGPTQAAALLETDKFFSHTLMKDLHIPQATSLQCRSLQEIYAAIEDLDKGKGIVLKARGLAKGKGVIVCDSADEARKSYEAHFHKFGPDVLVSEKLFGPEFSFFAFCDGKNASPFPIVFKDYKRQSNGDKGPNTGGMGAYGPVFYVSSDDIEKICASIVNPVMKELESRSTPYRGFLYAGMILCDDGWRVLEFNARFGDPECQAAMVLLRSDLGKLIRACLDSKIQHETVDLFPGGVCCVTVADPDYPHGVTTGRPITLPETMEYGVDIFHSATKFDEKELKSSGGRILTVTGYSARGLEHARERAYDSVQKIDRDGSFQHRSDIGEIDHD